jgi:AcrR family transcriptional regulator
VIDHLRQTFSSDGGGSGTSGTAAWENGVMEEEPRRLRADAERNRRRLIEAATAMFSEGGLDVGVAEIAQRAGVGRGTLFRNFPSKDDLVVAVVVDRIQESIDRARVALDRPDAAEGLFEFIDSTLELQQHDRALFEALSDEWMVRPEIRSAHGEMVDVTAQLLGRAQAEGAVRTDISAIDVILMVKGVCETARSFQHIDPEVGMRQIDLVRAAITAPGVAARPLRGRPPAADDLQHVFECAVPAPAVPGAAAVPDVAAVKAAG